MTTDSLIKSVSIEAMFQARDAVEERLAFIYPLVKEIDGIAQHTPGISGFKTIAEKRGGHSRGEWALRKDENPVPPMLRELDRAWQHLMNESGLRTFMDADTRAKWDYGLYDTDAVPPLTLGTIQATFEEGVVKAFQRLSWDYKRNLPQKFGKRCVLTSLVRFWTYREA